LLRSSSTPSCRNKQRGELQKSGKIRNRTRGLHWAYDDATLCNDVAQIHSKRTAIIVLSMLGAKTRTCSLRTGQRSASTTDPIGKVKSDPPHLHSSCVHWTLVKKGFINFNGSGSRSTGRTQTEVWLGVPPNNNWVSVRFRMRLVCLAIAGPPVCPCVADAWHTRSTLAKTENDSVPEAKSSEPLPSKMRRGLARQACNSRVVCNVTHAMTGPQRARQVASDPTPHALHFIMIPPVIRAARPGR